MRGGRQRTGNVLQIPHGQARGNVYLPQGHRRQLARGSRRPDDVDDAADWEYHDADTSGLLVWTGPEQDGWGANGYQGVVVL